MSQSSKRTKAATTVESTADVVAAIKTVQEMGRRRCRFVLVALLTGEHVSIAAFNKVVQMADTPVPIEAGAIPNETPFGEAIQ